MRGLAVQIANRAFQLPVGKRGLGIAIGLRINKLSGNAAVAVMEKSMLVLTESEMPEAAMAYYARQKPYIPSAIDDQVAEIRQGWRDDVEKIQCTNWKSFPRELPKRNDLEFIPAGYARVSDYASNSRGQIVKIRCVCNDPENALWRSLAFFKDRDYFNNEEVSNQCPVCHTIPWYTIKEDCHETV